MSIYHPCIKPRSLGLIAGIGLFIFLPDKARADHDDESYGHAEITLGFPNGQVTVGKTWENHPREVVVEEVTHRFPNDDDDEDDADQIIIEKHVKRPCPKKVVIIERYEEPAYCDRSEVVRRVYVEPPCHRPEVVVYRQPERIIYAPSCRGRGHAYRGDGYQHGYTPSNNVIIVPPSGGSYHRESGGAYHYKSGGGTVGGGSGPRDLFPKETDRPMRQRGVQQQASLVRG
jgi:hypothetical protein